MLGKALKASSHLLMSKLIPVNILSFHRKKTLFMV